MFSNEDVTIGAWMLAMNVNHENDRQLCEAECSSSTIAVWDIPKCSGNHHYIILSNISRAQIVEIHALFIDYSGWLMWIT